MTTQIKLLADREEIMVGDTVFSGGPAAGGGLAIDGRVVRPLSLGERDELVELAAIAVGDSAVQELARLVGSAATSCNHLEAPDVTTAAIEAVALHLAGASMPGPLAQTALLVARSVGAGGGAMPALAADRIAAALADGLAADGTVRAVELGGSREGWTTIDYATPAPATVEAATTSSDSVLAVRNSLAEALLARGVQPLAVDLIEKLFGLAPGAPAEPIGVSDIHVRSPAGDGRLAPGVLGGPPADRWLEPAAALRWSPGGYHDGTTTVAARSDPRTPHADRWSDDHETSSIDPWQPTKVETGPPGASSVARRQPPPVEAPTAPSALPHLPGAAQEPVDRRHEPVPPIGVAVPRTFASPVDSLRKGTDAAVGLPTPWPFPFRRRPADRPGVAARQEHFDLRAPKALDRGTATASLDLDDVAHALHRAADLRGLPR